MGLEKKYNLNTPRLRSGQAMEILYPDKKDF